MVGMPWAFAFWATVPPISLLIEAMIRTLTPSLIMPSASVLNFCTSPWAFWMSGSRPSALSAASSIGLSKPSQRADVAVSGRMTPTGMPPEDWSAVSPPPPLPPPVSSLAPHADRTRGRPTPAPRSESLVLRIQRSLHSPQGEMLRCTTYARTGSEGRHVRAFCASCVTQFGNEPVICPQTYGRPLPGTQRSDAFFQLLDGSHGGGRSRAHSP